LHKKTAPPPADGPGQRGFDPNQIYPVSRAGYTLSTTYQVVNGNATNKVTFAPAADATVDEKTIECTNTYTVYQPASIVIPGTKTLEGKELKGNDFTFQIKSKDGKDTWNILPKDVKNRADGSITFPALAYTAENLQYASEPVTFQYEVFETTQDGEGITVDPRVFTVTVTVTPDTDAGKYTASITSVTVRENKDAEQETEVTGNKISFENKYETTPIRVPLEALKKLTTPKATVIRNGVKQEIPAALSYTAGTFVCNDVLYTLLHRLSGTGIRGGFVHVPYSAAQAAEKSSATPSMSLQMIVQALTVLVENL